MHDRKRLPGHVLFLLTETVVSRRYAVLRSRRPMWSPTIFEKSEQQLSRCTQIQELRLFVFNPFPGFNCIVTALKSRTVANKTRTKFPLKFVRDISTKMTLSSFRALVSIGESSTNSSGDSGFKCPGPTARQGTSSWGQRPGWAGFAEMAPPGGTHWLGGRSAPVSTNWTIRSNACWA
jgi:hypothetical protein